ncbi:MAG: plastocyanin/azurin family copper-binding protein, partial [Chitinophagales bacterium]
MKKLNLLFLFTIIFLGFSAKATIHEIQVEDNEFNPSNLNVMVGDTIKWFWDNSAGDHTTTSTSVPDGALTWDAPIAASSQTFIYVVTLPGSYNYKCTIHAGMGMTGNFNATGGTAIESNDPSHSINLNSLVKDGQLQINYSIENASLVSINLIDETGRLIQSVEIPVQSPGNYIQNWMLESTVKGIYFVQFSTNYFT